MLLFIGFEGFLDFQVKPNCDQVGTKWDQVGTKWHQVGTKWDQVGTNSKNVDFLLVLEGFWGYQNQKSFKNIGFKSKNGFADRGPARPDKTGGDPL